MDFGAGTDFWEGMCGFRRMNGSASGWGPRTGETSESPPFGVATAAAWERTGYCAGGHGGLAGDPFEGRNKEGSS